MSSPAEGMVQSTSPESTDSTWTELSNPEHGELGSNIPSSHQENSSVTSEPTMKGAESQKALEPSKISIVDMGHSDTNLRVHNTIFRTHRHLLANFNRLEEKFTRGSPGSYWSVQLDQTEQGVEDVTNTFEILYASVIAGPFEFEPSVLISALRMASIYDYSALRAYSIDRLEKARLGPVQRITLAREFGLTSWEEPAFEELYKREDALTDEEAEILGVISFAKVARMREGEKLKQGKEIGEREYKRSLERTELERREKELAARKEGEEKERKRREAAEREAKERRQREELAKKEKEIMEREYKEALLQEKEKKEREERARKASEEKAWRGAEIREATRQARNSEGINRKSGVPVGGPLMQALFSTPGQDTWAKG